MVRIPVLPTVAAFGALIALPAVAQPDLDDAMRDLGLIQGQGSGTGDVYVVEPGDTLWDICVSFFDDPEYWPTLWSINNSEITNPHYIYPGQLLRFDPGTDVRPPSIVVGDASPFEDLTFDESFVPLSESFGKPGECQRFMPFSTISGADVTLSSPVFVARNEVEPLGALVSAMDPKAMLARGDLVYLRFRNTSDVNCGDVYSLYREDRDIKHPEVKSTDLGKSYSVSGEVLVTQVGERWVTGRIVNSYAEIERGELITDRVPVAGRIRVSEPSQELDGFIVQVATREAELLQRNQVVYIDLGRSHGVQSGSSFWIVRRGDGLTKAKKQDPTLPYEVVGRVIVYSADENVSTAVVTDQALDVRVGDRITTRLD
jgi:hypothetical protein